MKKAFAIICTGILVVIFSFLLIRIIQSFFTIYFYYDYVIWCGKEEKEYIDLICEQVEPFLKGISRRKNPSQIVIVNEVFKKI